MITYMIPFGFAFLVVWLLVPILRRVAYKYHFVDVPNQRKVHQVPIPLLGGLAIIIGYLVTAWIWIEPIKIKLSILVTGLLIGGIGLLDDYYKTRKRELAAFPKILIQMIVGVILFLFSIRIEGISAVFREGMYLFNPVLSLFFTLLWVVGLMNMINFLDGADGLASGIALISSMTLFLIAVIKEQEVIAYMTIILMGVNLGFLRYNFFPAKIFMGDTGSAFLGLILAIISIEGALKSATIFSILMVIFALGVPIFDTVIVLMNRWRQRKPLHIADKTHAHHRLLKKGYSQKQAVTIIYAISLLFSLISATVFFWFIYK